MIQSRAFIKKLR